MQDLTLATDLMSASQPTVAVPAPDWAPHEGTPWLWIGLGAGLVVVLLGGAALVLGRRRHM